MKRKKQSAVLIKRREQRKAGKGSPKVRKKGFVGNELFSRRRKRRRAAPPKSAQRIVFTRSDYETTALILAMVEAISSDAGTRLKAHRALKSFRKLKRLVRS